jgi:SHS2 domain-containing protein
VTFELVDHPADIGFRAYGTTLEELFATCARALVSIVLDPSDIRLINFVSVPGIGGDLESLLVNWLNEVLYQVDGRRVALGEFAIGRVSETNVDCVARGEPRDRERHPSRVIVKAVTYHQLRVERTADGWVAEVYVDV